MNRLNLICKKGFFLIFLFLTPFFLVAEGDTLELKQTLKQNGKVVINKYYHKTKSYLVKKEKFRKGKKLFMLEYKPNGKIIRSENRRGKVREHKDCGCK
jgi:hypothetical protein